MLHKLNNVYAIDSIIHM